MRKINKNGKTGNGAKIFMSFVGVAVLLLVLAQFGILGDIGRTPLEDTPAEGCPVPTSILTVSAISAVTGGTDPSSPTITCGINGGKVTTAVTSGTTPFSVGDDLECLVSKADYIDRSFKLEASCGATLLEAPMFYATSDNPSVTIKDPNNGDATVSDDVAGGTGTNLTGVSTGETVEFDVEFKGTAGEGSGDMIYVIEFPAGSSANITDVTMSGAISELTSVSVPQVHSAVNAGSKLAAFSVPAVEGATKMTYSVIATLGTTKDLTGGILTDVYAAQDFIDDDKTISSGIEDSDGTVKYENTLDRDLYLDA